MLHPYTKGLAQALPFVALLAFGTAPRNAQAQYSRNGAKYAVPTRDNYQRAEAGYDHLLEIRRGKLFAAGNNNLGQLGNGSTTASTSGVRVGSADNWVLISAGSGFSTGIKADGSLWTWGGNDQGQLGNGSTTNSSSPAQVGTDHWASISAGEKFVLAIRTDGSLWAWGANGSGQVAQGSTGNAVTTPTRVGSANDWAAVSAGEKHALALKADGSLWSWGENYLGQLGHGSTGWEAVTSPVRIGTANNWKHIGAGGYFSTAVQANGSLWVWGDDYYGQVTGTEGTPVPSPSRVGTADNWVRTFPGRYHLTALAANGILHAWGKNEAGELGTGTGSPSAPTALTTIPGAVQATNGDGFSAVVRSNGELSVWGQASANGVLGTELNNSPTLFSSTQEVLSTATRHGFISMALYSDGSIQGWGYGDDGVFAEGSDADRAVPARVDAAGNNNISVSVGYGQVLVLKDDGSAWGWGDNTGLQVGSGSGNAVDRTPARLGTGDNWISVVAGSHHSNGIKADGSLWAWGTNSNGRLGTGTSERQAVPVQIGTDHDWVAVSGGASHTIALKADGSIWGWGRNYAGETGTSTSQDDQPYPTRIGERNDWVQINAHTMSSAAITADGNLYGWGSASSGQLTGQHTGAIFSPVLVGNGYVTAELGSWSGAGIRADGQLEAWGGLNMVFGELGMGDNVNRTVATLVPNKANVVHISSGQCHKMAVTAERKSVCGVGRNANGEAGTGSGAMSHNAYVCGLAPVAAILPLSIDVSTVNNVDAVIEGMGNTLAVQALIAPIDAEADVIWSIVPLDGTATITADGTVTAGTPGTVYAKAVTVADASVRDSIAIELRSGTAVQEAISNNTLVLFPNPTSDRITLRNSGLSGQIQLLITDRMGRVVFQQSIALGDGTADNTINVSSLAAGSYLLVLQQADGTRISSRLLKH